MVHSSSVGVFRVHSSSVEDSVVTSSSVWGVYGTMSIVEG